MAQAAVPGLGAGRLQVGGFNRVQLEADDVLPLLAFTISNGTMVHLWGCWPAATDLGTREVIIWAGLRFSVIVHE
jgi:hypothetical protein